VKSVNRESSNRQSFTIHAFHGLTPTLLCVALLLWRPLDFAIELPMALPSLGMRGAVGAIELLFHAAVAAIAVAAVRAIWGGMPAGVLLACIALIASAVASVQSLNWSALPRQTAPGEALPLSIGAVLHASAWLLYLRMTNRGHR
jgi:hypothetical protein